MRDVVYVIDTVNFIVHFELNGNWNFLVTCFGKWKQSKRFSHLGWQPKFGDQIIWTLPKKNSSINCNFLGNDQKNSMVGSMATIDQTINFFLNRQKKFDCLI